MHGVFAMQTRRRDTEITRAKIPGPCVVTTKTRERERARWKGRSCYYASKRMNTASERETNQALCLLLREVEGCGLGREGGREGEGGR